VLKVALDLMLLIVAMASGGFIRAASGPVNRLQGSAENRANGVNWVRLDDLKQRFKRPRIAPAVP
jgi:hypothetical protein